MTAARSAHRLERLRGTEPGLTLAGVLTIAVLIGFVVLALTAQRGLPLRSYYTIHATFRSAGEIEQYSDVRIAGNLVGQVLNSSYRNGTAELTLQLQAGIEPLRTSTTAQIRLKGLLGARYVQLVPGSTGGPIPEGGTIPLAQTSTAVDVFHVLEAFDAPRRRDLRQTLDALGEGFLGRGSGLNGALANAPLVTTNTQAYSSALDAEPAAVQRLIPAAQSLSDALDPVRARLATGFAPEARSLAPFVDERPATEATLQLAPSALPAVRDGLAQTDPLLAETAAFATAAVQLTHLAPASLRSATALLRAAPGPLGQLTPLLDTLRRAVDPTLALTAGLQPLIAPATSVLDHSRPVLQSVGTHGCDVLGFLRNWRSLLGYGQASGTNDPIGPSNYVMVGVAANADAAGPSGPKPAALIGHDPYPPACGAQTETTR